MEVNYNNLDSLLELLKMISSTCVEFKYESKYNVTNEDLIRPSDFDYIKLIYFIFYLKY